MYPRLEPPVPVYYPQLGHLQRLSFVRTPSTTLPGLLIPTGGHTMIRCRILLHQSMQRLGTALRRSGTAFQPHQLMTCLWLSLFMHVAVVVRAPAVYR